MTGSNHPAFDVFVAGLKKDALNARTSTWRVIDRLVEGRRDLGDELFWQAVHAARYSEGTVTNYLSLGATYPKDKRLESVPFSVHETIRTLPEDQRRTVLEIADQYEWTREDVRGRMLAWKQGEQEAWDPRWKPARKAKVVDITEKPIHAGVNEDRPVMDATATGERLASEGHERPEFAANTANQQLLDILSSINRLRPMLNSIDLAAVNLTELCQCNAVLNELARKKVAFDHRKKVGHG